MKAFFLVLLGGGIGSVLRYGVGLLLKPSVPAAFPWHTLSVNLAGCFIIGVVSALLSEPRQDDARLFLIVGLLGGFTTFSSFGIETFGLLQTKQYALAGGYVILSNVAGLLLVAIGYKTASLIV